jgi:hypothetical protein
VVIINGPQESIICATPTSDVPAGYYDVDPETMVLIER